MPNRRDKFDRSVHDRRFRYPSLIFRNGLFFRLRLVVLENAMYSLLAVHPSEEEIWTVASLPSLDSRLEGFVCVKADRHPQRHDGLYHCHYLRRSFSLRISA